MADYKSKLKPSAGVPSYVSKLRPIQAPEAPKSFVGKTLGIAGAVGSALTKSEQGFGREIAAAIGAPSAQRSATAINTSNTTFLQNAIKLRNELKKSGKDTSKSDALIKQMLNQGPRQVEDVLPSVNDTAGQVYGNALGTGLDILAFGSYGKSALGAQTGQLLSKSARAAATPIVTGVGKKTLGQTLKGVGTKTAQGVAIGAGTGYGYDVASNLQSGDTGLKAAQPGLGTLIGGAVPLAVGAFQATKAITKSTAPKFINGLIRPNKASFSYGKDPGRTVSELGITGNSLPDFEKNLNQSRQDIGAMIGAVYDDPRVQVKTMDLSDEIAKIDDAIKEAAKGGKNNQGIVTTLQNIKEALLNEHTIDDAGNIIKRGSLSPAASTNIRRQILSGRQMIAEAGKPVADVVEHVRRNIVAALNSAGETKAAEKIAMIPAQASLDDFARAIDDVTPLGKDIQNISPKDAFALKDLVSAQTKFTGSPSDDKTVNAVLKSIYGGIKDKLNKTVSPFSPEITDLNEKYADLTSAVLATANRDAIVKRSGIVSFPIQVGGAAGLITALATGGSVVPAILTGISVAAFDSAIASTAVRSRLAAWLGKQSPGVVASILQKNPAIRTSLTRLIPKVASQLGQGEPR